MAFGFSHSHFLCLSFPVTQIPFSQSKIGKYRFPFTPSGPCLEIPLFVLIQSVKLAISQSPGSSRANARLEGHEIWQHTFKLNDQCKKEILHFWSSIKWIFGSRYFYSFTYSTPVTMYFVPPNDPRMHCDLFWERLIQSTIRVRA